MLTHNAVGSKAKMIAQKYEDKKQGKNTILRKGAEKQAR
jgi:hypothetical protein